MNQIIQLLLRTHLELDVIWSLIFLVLQVLELSGTSGFRIDITDILYDIRKKDIKNIYSEDRRIVNANRN